MKVSIKILLIIIAIVFCIIAFIYLEVAPHLQEEFNTAMDRQDQKLNSLLDCIDNCVHNGGVYETCQVRCGR
ncbi:MAG: hypothetical protein MUO73_03445 [Thermoplasmata archaeon]|nr:hypothetical protein [Thermoplasmata archaeon]